MRIRIHNPAVSFAIFDKSRLNILTTTRILVHRHNVPRQNVPRDTTSQDKTSSDIRSQGQNVPRTKCPKDKTSQGTKRPKRQNVPRKKNPNFNFQFFKNRFCPHFFENGPHMLDITILGRLGHIGLGNGPHMYEYTVGWSVEFFFDRTEQGN